MNSALPELPHARPPVADRRFTSPAVEDAIARLQRQIADPALRVLVENCLPNTLDTTVYPGAFDKHPDTYVVTGDIDAMWLRDSSAQVWPYLRLARKDARLRMLLEGVVRRQARMIHLDPYANAFTRNTTRSAALLGRKRPHGASPGRGRAQMGDRFALLSHPAGLRLLAGDGRCRTVRRAVARRGGGDSAHLYRAAAQAVAAGRTVSSARRRLPTTRWALSGFGNPARPNGMIFSMFRPSDDACIFPLFVPANLFAAKALGQLAELAAHAAQDTALAARASALAMKWRRRPRSTGA